MRMRNVLLLSLLISLAVWALYAWPLPRVVFSGIPASQDRDGPACRRMTAGDHLQFLYHLWLTADMVRGETPLFHNPYEFNTGRDQDRFRRSALFLPFSLVYAAAAQAGGRAFGMNTAAFLSLWLGYLFTWLLARRYTDRDATAAAAALVALALPYRWNGILGGSPAGLAACWVPGFLLGLDLAVRKGSHKGGALAGLCLLFAAWGDAHVLFFSVLVAPCWCLLAAVATRPATAAHLRPLLRRLVALWPAGAGLLLALLYRLWKMQNITESVMAHGRSWAELALYSPRWKALLSLEVPSLGRQVYTGGFLAGVVLLGLVGLWVRRRRLRGSFRPMVVLLLLVLGVAAVLTLALGIHGPVHGLPLRAVRKLIPPYRMIRQPAKIFLLAPTLLSVAVAMALTGCQALTRKAWWPASVLSVFAMVLLADYQRPTRPSICLLDTEQQAYEAVARDAGARGTAAHALAVPLWPGNSHWSSLYQYYASLYRIRMVNGYSPTVKRSYRERVFFGFDSVNKGALSDCQLEALQRMRVRYLLLHENAFPEIVSPLPVAFTLKSLLNHPRLELMEQDGEVWAFRILPDPVHRPEAAPHWNTFFPTRHWEWEDCAPASVQRRAVDTAAGGRAVVLKRPGESSSTAHRPNPPRMVWAPDLRWLVRLRGQGELSAVGLLDGRTNTAQRLSVQSAAWTWAEVRAQPFPDYGRLKLHLALESGGVELDSAILTAGIWPALDKGEVFRVPAPCFFHAGHTDLRDDSVVFDPERDFAGKVLYGPDLPFQPGRYTITLQYESGAPFPTRLGTLAIAGGGATARVPILAGKPVQALIDIEQNLPVRVALMYTRRGSMRVQHVAIRREAR